MADISQIKDSQNNIYNLKDTTARSGLNDVRTDTTILATSSSSPITDAANGVFQKLTVQGESRESKNQLHITADTGAQSGVTFTVNRNSGGEVESIFVNGTNTSTGYIHYNIGKYTSTMNGCVLSGCPSGGSSDTYRLWVSGFPITNDIGEGVVLELAGIATSGNITISIGPGYTASNLVFRPMVCTAAEYEADPTFEPHGIISVGENGSVTLTSANSGNTVSTTATFTTGMPLLSANDVYDELDCAAGVVHKRCEYDSENETVTVLATPYDLPLTDTEKAAFRSLRTYSGTTNLTITDEPDFELNYIKNTDNGQAVADIQQDLQGQIDEVSSQIDEVKNEKNHFCYSYKIDLSDSNPATCVKPHFDTRYGCDNFSFTSAKMNYTTGVFDYGSWEGFIRRIARPCMLKYDGTVDYYLDPDDYSKKITGEASDVADVNYQGNAMVELEKLYFKRYTYNGIQYCFISDRKLDKSFKCYAHHDKYGKELDYIYRAAYDGSYDGTRLRSISGIDYHNLNALTVNKIMSNTTRAEEIAFAQANNVASEQGEGWYILHKSEWDYINDILFLIGMSTDVQTTFGRGRDSGYVSATDTGIISTGTMDDKGLFWGKNNGSAGVKVLGIENHWANIFKSCAGWINDKGTQKVKYTYGTEDGSTGEGYNITADGYISIAGATPTKGDESTSGGGYITAWQYGDYGILPYEAISGASNKYLCDYIWFNNTAACFALVGGRSGDGLPCGAFCSGLDDGAGDRNWGVGAALSYKPLSAA